MDSNLGKKLTSLKEILHNTESLLVAFSGGVDSAFLLTIAKQTLEDKVMAVTAQSATYTREEIRHACNFAKDLKVRHKIIETEELANPKFFKNPANRCFFCKKELFSKLNNIARRHNLKWVADGSNIDDMDDFRPGRLAARRLNVRSPLKEAGLTKDDIRRLSKSLGLSTWDRPSLACLASRFPYNTRITQEALRRIDEAESYLRKVGFAQVRVRHYGELARIEVLKKDIPKLIKLDIRKIVNKFKKLGYNYTTVDLEGYRSGSMNETLDKDKRKLL